MPIAPRVQPQALPQVRVKESAPLEAFGGGQAAQNISQGVSNVAKTITKIGLEEKRKADDTQVKNFLAEATKLKNDRMYNPESGAFTKRGQDAFGVIDEYVPAFKKDLDDLEKNLHNDDQRAMARDIRLRLETEFNGALQKHVFKERTVYADEVTKSGLVNARNDAVLNYQTPGKIEDAINLQKVLIQSHADDHGQSAEWVKQTTEKAVSQTHRDIIERMLANGQDREASAYFKAHKDEVGGDDIAAVEKTLEIGSIDGESMRLSDSYRAQGLSMSQSVEKAREIDDPKLRKATIEKIKGDFALDEAAKRDQTENIMLKGANIIEKGGKYEDLSPSERANLTVSERSSLRAYSQSMSEGKYIHTDLGVYQEIKQMFADPRRRNEALKYNLLKHVNEIEPSTMKQLIDQQAGLRKGDSSTAKVLDGYLTDRNIVDNVLVKSGFKGDQLKGEEAVKFRDYVDKRIQRYQEETGKKTTNEDVRRMANEAMFEVSTGSVNFLGIHLWDKTKPLYQLEPGEEFTTTVPQAEAQKIREKLQKAGLPATDQDILKIYMRVQSGR